MSRVFVARRLPGNPLERLARERDVDLWESDLPPAPGVLRERTAPCDGLLTLISDRVDGGLLEAAPRLRGVSSYSAGEVKRRA
jgi:glyoxylate reductase